MPSTDSDRRSSWRSLFPLSSQGAFQLAVAVALTILGLGVLRQAASAPPRHVQAQATSAAWQDISPSGLSWNFNSPANNFGASTVVTDPSGDVYLGTNYQGIWKSTNGGTTWAKLDTGIGASLVDSGRNWALQIDPFNPSILWTIAGYAVGGPLKSTDGGVSWTQTFPSTNSVEQQIGTNDIYGIALDPYVANHVVANFHYYWLPGTSDSGLIQSFDGGATWSVVNPPAGAGWGAGNAVWFLDSSSDWLVGSQKAGYWRTTNSGASWSQVLTVNMTYGGINSFVEDGSTYYITATAYSGNANVYKSTNLGVSWTNIGQGLADAGFEALAVDNNNL